MVEVGSTDDELDSQGVDVATGSTVDVGRTELDEDSQGATYA